MAYGVSLPICRFARTRVFSRFDVARPVATHQTPIRIKAHDGHLAHIARHPAPGTHRAPENPRYPAVSNRDDHSSCGSPRGVHPEAGSRQRRRKNMTNRSEAIWHGLRQGLISLAGYEPSRLQASRLSPHSARGVTQTPWPHQTAPGAASCDNTPGPTCAPPSCGPLARWFSSACVGNSAGR